MTPTDKQAVQAALDDINRFYGKSGIYGLTQESYTDHLSSALLSNIETIISCLEAQMAEGVKS